MIKIYQEGKMTRLEETDIGLRRAKLSDLTAGDLLDMFNKLLQANAVMYDNFNKKLDQILNEVKYHG